MKIRGVVVDENGERIAGALVNASRGDSEACVATRTDADGCFAFDIEPDNEHSTKLHAYASGRSSGVFNHWDNTPGGSALTLDIVPTVAVHGHIVDKDGSPVHGALVATWGSNTTTTDASGGYRLAGLRPGRIHLHAWRNGLQLQTATIVVGEGSRLDWTLQPASGRSIRLTFTEATASDVRPRWILSCHHPVHLHIEGRFPDSGEVTLAGLPTEHCLQGGVSVDGLRPTPINHYLEPDPRPGLVEWRTHLAQAVRQAISGILVDEHNRPMPATALLVECLDTSRNTCTTDAEGRFVCEVNQSTEEFIDDDLVFSMVDKSRVMDDRHSMAWANPRCRGVAYRPPSPDASIVLRTAAAAAVRGRVLRGGRPVPGALVTLFIHWIPQDEPMTSRLDAKDTDEDGQFLFAGLNAAIGDGLFARIQAPDIDILTDDIALQQGATVTLSPIHATTLATVSGRLLDGNGTALAASFVFLQETSGRLGSWDHHGTNSDAEGRFVIRNVRPGDYELGVTGHELDSTTTIIASNVAVAGGQTLDLGDLTS